MNTGALRPLDTRGQYITLLLALWTLLGLFVDVWAHGQPNLVESFFTPWHAIFYSGFLATAGWMLWPVARGVQNGKSPFAEVPAGYELGAAGVLVFAVGGLADMVWHTALGIERGISIQESPPHILLIIGLTLITLSPFRSAWAAQGADDDAPSLRAFLPALLSLTLVTCIISIIIIYQWGFTASHFMMGGTVERVWGVLGSNSFAAQLIREAALHRAISNVIISNLVLYGPILIMLRRWQPPFGSATILLTVTTLLMAAVTGFVVPSLLVVPVIGGLAADVLIQALRPSPQRVGALRAFATIAPMALWSPYFLVAHVLWHVAWPPEVWGGVIVWTGISGLGLSLVAVPSPSTA